jgi:spoIIIJ-associated protein
MAIDTAVVEHGATFLSGLIERMGLEGIVITPAPLRDDTVFLKLTGQIDLLKNHPEITAALTLLTSQAASRMADARVRCLLDVGGGFAERETLLKVLARDLAEAVERTGRIAVVERLSSAERRMVHSVLADHAHVSTQSEGTPDARWLTVQPAAQTTAD